MERKDSLDAFRGAFEKEDADYEHRQMAELMFHVASFIIQRDFYRGRYVNRKIIGQRYARSQRHRSDCIAGLDDAVGILVHRMAHDGMITDDRRTNADAPFRRSTKFRLRVDDETRAKYYELLAFLGQQAQMDEKIVNRNIRTAVFIRQHPGRPGKL